MDFLDVQPLLAWTAQHPYWAGAAVFLVSLSESLVIVGLFIPGTVVMFGVGALVAAGALELWATLGWAALGAVAGDGASYWLGRRYRETLWRLWPFSRFPQALARGEAFFHRHGGKSVLLGRFLGPVRPVIPTVAGMLGMSPARFYAVNILSALGWAPAYILPGVVFGASLELAGAVATRLAVFIALLVLTIWGAVWTIRRCIYWLQTRLDGGLVLLREWASSAPPAGRRPLRELVAALIDPTQPEAPALSILAGALIATAWIVFRIVEGVAMRESLALVNSSVYHTLRGLRTPLGDSIMIALTGLGDAVVMLAVIIAVLLRLSWKRAWRATAYWLAAAGFATALTVIVEAAMRAPPPSTPTESVTLLSFPGSHAAMSIVIYGFLAVLAGRELSPKGRTALFTALILLVILIAFSRLYLGAHWLSDVLAGLTFGTAWVAVSGIAYVSHPSPALSARGLLIAALSALLVGGSWHVSQRHVLDTAPYAVRQVPRTLAEPDWWRDAWQSLPAWRIDIEGEYEQPMTVQWAGSLESLHRTLLARGWQDPLPLPGKNLLLWLDITRPADQLPLLPRVHDGNHEALAVIYPMTNQLDQRMVLRLWPASAVLRETGRPVWIGMVTRETVRRPLSWFNAPRDGKDFNQPRDFLSENLTGLPLRLAQRREASNPKDRQLLWDKQVLLVREPGQP